MTPAKLDGTPETSDEDEMEVSSFVQLLVARMRSHPLEFYKWAPNTAAMSANPLHNSGGANQLIENTKGMWNRKEKRLYNIALREVRLQEAYERLAKHLLK